MIPLIDCSIIANQKYESISFEDFNNVAQEIGAAMTGIGMCNIINHGVAREKIEKIYEVSKTFFDLPRSKKSQYRKVSPATSFHGYTGPGEELLNQDQKNSIELRESWDTWGSDGSDEKMFPNEVAGFKVAFDDIRSELENSGKKILRCIEIYLELEEGALVSNHSNIGDRSIPTRTSLRSLNYFTLNSNYKIPPNAIRCGEHSDWGTLTFLIQDMIGGLEVQTLKGNWIAATPVENAILLNSGQILEYWTGGHFHAAKHRVRIIADHTIADRPRQSFAYFINPDDDVNIFPIVPVLAEKEVQFKKFKCKPINALNFVQRLIEDSTY